MLATLFVVRTLAVDQETTQRASLASSTRALAAAVDGEINRHFATAAALATSQALVERDFATFYRQASEAIKVLPASWVLLVDTKGQQIINTLRPYGDPLTNVGRSDAHQRVMETLKPVVSNVVVGQVSGQATTGVFYPVIYDGKIAYDLVVVLNPNSLGRIMREQKLPEGFLNGVIDRVGNFVARNLGDAKLIGTPASSSWRNAAKASNEGFFDGTSIEGESTITYFINLPRSDWSVAIGASKKVMNASINESLWQVGLLSAVLIALGIASALWFGRRITRPLQQLEVAAAALIENKKITLARTDLREVNRALDAFEITSSALAERQQRQQILVTELNHRVKNTMSMIHSVAVLAARSATDVKDMMNSFTTRLFGISRTQDLLMQSQWSGAQFRDLASSELSPYDNEERTRIVLEGDAIQFSATQATSISMVIHELATNAVKYGALSRPEGRVELKWARTGNRLTIEWRETGGPSVAPPIKEGFGSRLIDVSVKRQLGGTLNSDYRPAGLHCVIEFSLEAPDTPAAQS